MKHIIISLIACTIFPLTMQAQIYTVMDMHHKDDTLDVKYTKEMLLGKLWEFVGEAGSARIEFKGDSLIQTFVVEDKKYVFTCVYYLSDSYQMDYEDEKEDHNRAGKYLQLRCFDSECDGTGEIADRSYWIKKLTDDTLEIIEWRTRKSPECYHVKPLKEQ